MNENYDYKRLKPFKWFVLQNFPFIDEDFDAITNYQLFCKLGEEINKVIESMNLAGQQVEELTDFVNNYFDDLDIQEEINTKLDEMAEDGTLEQIISEYLQTKTFIVYNNLSELKDATNLIDGSYVQTLGYNSINDGGKAKYIVRTKTNEDVPNDMNIIQLSDENLVAEMIIENDTINIKSLGAINNTDITSKVEKALTLAKNIYFPNEEYTISNLQIENEHKLYGKAIINLIAPVGGYAIFSNVPDIIFDGLTFKGGKAQKSMNTNFGINDDGGYLIRMSYRMYEHGKKAIFRNCKFYRTDYEEETSTTQFGHFVGVCNMEKLEISNCYGEIVNTLFLGTPSDVASYNVSIVNINNVIVKDNEINILENSFSSSFLNIDNEPLDKNGKITDTTRVLNNKVIATQLKNHQCIGIGYVKNAIYEGNYIRNYTVPFDLDNPINVTVENNKFVNDEIDSNANGIRVGTNLAYSTGHIVENITINNNIIENFAYGITTNKAKNLIISNNKFKGNSFIYNYDNVGNIEIYNNICEINVDIGHFQINRNIFIKNNIFNGQNENLQIMRCLNSSEVFEICNNKFVNLINGIATSTADATPTKLQNNTGLNDRNSTEFANNTIYPMFTKFKDGIILTRNTLTASKNNSKFSYNGTIFIEAGNLSIGTFQNTNSIISNIDTNINLFITDDAKAETNTIHFINRGQGNVYLKTQTGGAILTIEPATSTYLLIKDNTIVKI